MNRLRWICIVILLVLPIQTSADEEIKLTRQQEEMLEKMPAERRDQVRKQLIESRKKARDNMREIVAAQKKLMPRLMKRIPEMTTDNGLGGLQLMGDLRNDEFLAYVGLDKEKGKEFLEKMQANLSGFGTGPTDLFKKAAATDDPAELDKISDEFFNTISKVVKSQGEVLQKGLSPEQYDKFRELRLINSSTNKDNGMLFDFGQYAALELTDEQRRKLDLIRADYTRDFQPIMEKIMEVQIKFMERMSETGDFKEARESIKQEQEEAEKPIIQLNAATRARVLALLTKEQTAKLERILAGAPKYLAKRVGLIKEDDEAWKKSWKPGDPIPEGAVPDRPRGIFPMGM